MSGALAQDTGWIEKLEKENQDLRRRLEALEAVTQKEGILPSSDGAKPIPVKALSNTMLSGFVTTSFFYNSTTPNDRQGDGYLWTTRHNSDQRRDSAAWLAVLGKEVDQHGRC